MFIQYFMLTLTISLFCLGLRAITDDGMIGNPIRVFFQKHAPYWGKPIVLCSTCMSSFWGTVICLTLLFTLSLTATPVLFLMWLGSTISAAFVNAVCWEYLQSQIFFSSQINK